MMGRGSAAAARSRGRRAAPLVLAAMAVASLLLGGVATLAPAADAASGLQLHATIDGKPVARSSAAHPVRLHPGRAAEVDLQVTNGGARAVTLRNVTLDGSVAGLTFFSYQTSVSLTLQPGQSTHLRYALDLTGLDGQATGLIPARLSVADAHRHRLASQSFVSDVRGSLWSVYGLFGLALLALLLAAVGGAVWTIASGRMPRNRWRRALRLVTVGLGVGLVLVFSLSALRVWVPSAGKWLVCVFGFAAGFFALGYLTPTPGSDEDDEEPDEAEFLAPAPSAGPTPVAAASTAAASTAASPSAVPSASTPPPAPSGGSSS